MACEHGTGYEDNMLVVGFRNEGLLFEIISLKSCHSTICSAVGVLTCPVQITSFFFSPGYFSN